MQTAPQIHLRDVQEVYSGPEGRLWDLLMGAQIHIGGMGSSMELADLAGIGEGQRGVDLCSATGGGMRLLLRFRKVAHMTGVDATSAMIQEAQRRIAGEGMMKRCTFVEADVTASGLAGGSMDFVWGEDAWCYVEDKAKLIAEAVRLVKPGGTVAFTDWMEGSVPLTAEEAERCLLFMKFPSLATLADYTSLLIQNNCEVLVGHDTRRFARCVALYLEMIETQLTYDALQIIGFDEVLASNLIHEMKFMQSLAAAGKIIQGLVVARKRK